MAEKIFPFSAKADFLVHDATQPFHKPFDAIAFEGDLGLPHSQFIPLPKLQGIINNLDDLYIRFFRTLKYEMS